MKEEEILFKEEQKLRQWWLWLLLLGILGFFIYGSIQQLIFNKTFGNKPASDLGLLLSTLGFAALCYFFYTLNLVTTITKDELYIKYSFLVNKKVKWQNVISAEIIKYGFVGYGLRYSFKYGLVYNASGNKGLNIQSKYGKFVLGTQKPEELEAVVNKILPKH